MSGRNGISYLRLFCITIPGFFLAPDLSLAQEITNVDFTVNGSKVEVTYYITACPGNEAYDVRLFLGHEGELTEIKQGLRGDLKQVTCGSSNVIVWDVLSDREALEGPVFFAVEILRAHPVVNTDDYIIADEKTDEGSFGTVPYGDPDSGPVVTYRRHPTAYLAPFGIFQLGARIAFEQARAAILARVRPNVIVFPKHSGSIPKVPQRTRQR